MVGSFVGMLFHANRLCPFFFFGTDFRSHSNILPVHLTKTSYIFFRCACLLCVRFSCFLLLAMWWYTYMCASYIALPPSIVFFYVYPNANGIHFIASVNPVLFMLQWPAADVILCYLRTVCHFFSRTFPSFHPDPSSNKFRHLFHKYFTMLMIIIDVSVKEKHRACEIRWERESEINVVIAYGDFLTLMTNIHVHIHFEKRTSYGCVDIQIRLTYDLDSSPFFIHFFFSTSSRKKNM